MKSDSEFATSGVKHFKEWKFASGSLTSKKGSFGTGKARYCDKLTTMDVCGKTYLTGTLKGDLLVWNGNRLNKKSKNLFARPLDAIFTGPEYIYAGDRAGKVIILNDQI
jgi:hypothetical protein